MTSTCIQQLSARPNIRLAIGKPSIAARRPAAVICRAAAKDDASAPSKVPKVMMVLGAVVSAHMMLAPLSSQAIDLSWLKNNGPSTEQAHELAQQSKERVADIGNKAESAAASIGKQAEGGARILREKAGVKGSPVAFSFGGVQSKAEDTAGSLKAGAEDAVEGLKGKAGDAVKLGQQAQGGAKVLREKAGVKGSSPVAFSFGGIQSKAEDTSGSIKAGAEDAVEGLKDKAGEAVDALRGKADEVKSADPSAAADAVKDSIEARTTQTAGAARSQLSSVDPSGKAGEVVDQLVSMKDRMVDFSKVAAVQPVGLDLSTGKAGEGALIEFSDITDQDPRDVVAKLRDVVLPDVKAQLAKASSEAGDTYSDSILKELQTVQGEVESVLKQVEQGSDPSNVKSIASGIEQQVNALKANLGFT